MITQLLIQTTVSFFLFVLTQFNLIFQFLPDVVFDISSGVGYVFGNMWLLNDLLPISDLFVIATMAITFKTVLFGFKAVMFLMGFFNVVRRTFLSFRV